MRARVSRTVIYSLLLLTRSGPDYSDKADGLLSGISTGRENDRNGGAKLKSTSAVGPNRPFVHWELPMSPASVDLKHLNDQCARKLARQQAGHCFCDFEIIVRLREEPAPHGQTALFENGFAGCNDKLHGRPSIPDVMR